MGITRRHFVQGLGAGALLAGSRVFAATQLDLGEVSVQTLSDGHLTLPRELLFGAISPEDLEPVLEAHGIEPGPLAPPVNVTLMRGNGRLVLFDAGAGPGFQASAGQLAEALDAAGIAPEEITDVVFTHGHPDHLWGVLDDFDEPLFSEARHMMGRTEWDYWYDPALADTIGGGDRAGMAVGARRRMEVLADRITLFKDGEEILPGVAARATFGHTPGHMSFEIRSGSNSVMVLGDAIGNGHVSFAEPGWHVGTDHDPDAAAAVRAGLLDQLVHEQMPIIGYHLPDGGLGRAERAGSGYRFVPEAG
ncbi:MBL fold metallo-hydrolase [Roseobacteraceae bacterium NS-SX3]